MRPPHTPLPAPVLGEDFVSGFHAARPGITEDLLLPARDAAGRSPYGWLVEALGARGRVLDLACGSAPVADLVGAGRYLGVDRSGSELAEAHRRRPGLDLMHAYCEDLAEAYGTVYEPVKAVAVSMALMLIGLESCLLAVSRAGPGGRRPDLLAAIVPVRGDAVEGTGYGRILDALGQRGRAYPDPLDPRTLADRAAAAGWTLQQDELTWFDRPLSDDGDVDLVLSSFYAADADDADLAAARSQLEDIAGRRGALAYPIRRIVLRPGG